MSRYAGLAAVTEEELLAVEDLFKLPMIGQLPAFTPPGPVPEVELGQRPTPGEELVAEDLTTFLPRRIGSGLGQRPTPGEELVAEDLTTFLPRHEVLGFVGMVVSAGLQAAMPSVTSSLTKMTSSRSKKAARSDRNAAQIMIDGLMKMSRILHDGTDEMMALMRAGQRVDPFQIQEADMAAQQSMKAWQPAAEGYAALAGAGPDELGAAIPAHEAEMLARERLYLEGAGFTLGRSRGQKRAARIGWLTGNQKEFLDHMRAVNTNLNELAESAGIPRLTSSEADVALEEGVEAITPPTEARIAERPRKDAMLLPPPKKLPLGLIIGGGVGATGIIGLVLYLLLRK